MDKFEGRSFPGFLRRWVEINGERFTPVDYLNQEGGVPFTIAAQWLFVPDFVEYRGGLFWAELPLGISARDQAVVDQWFTRLDGKVSEVEKISNLLNLWDIFASCDTAPYEDDLSQLARSIARSWKSLLRSEYAARQFHVDVLDSEENGPQVTFYSA